MSLYEYLTEGVWSDTRNSFWIDIVKTLNLAVSSFLNKNLQQKASALTYSTILAVVPVIAMFFAIGRGFGFQNLLEAEFFKFFPAQKEALSQTFVFVDSYLEQTSEGLFLGIGIVLLLWTVINLMLNVESSFNQVWQIRKGRSLYRKITDYTAIFVIMPILMLLESGFSIFLATFKDFDDIFSPFVVKFADYIPIVISWFVFTAAFMLIPNTKVKFKNAILAGLLSGTAFQILQWLFISGQIYVSKYNAIYGSFAFLPLLIIWIHLTWIITLSGVVLTYSSQNIFSFNFKNHINDISYKYYNEVAIIVMALIIREFKNGNPAISALKISRTYELPIGLVTKIIDNLIDIGLVSTTYDEEGDKVYQPSIDINLITLKLFQEKLLNEGEQNFLKDFDLKFNKQFALISKNISGVSSDMLLKDLL